MAACLVGVVVLVGWALDILALKAALSSGLTMKANTALGLTVTAIAALLLRDADVRPGQRVAGRLLAALAVLLGGATLSQHLFGWDLHIDQLFFREPRGALATVSPNRMGPPASLAFVLLGGALLNLERVTSRGRSVAQWIATGVIAIGVLPMLGYLSGAEELYGVARYTGIAMHTAIALVLLATAVICARPHRYPAALLIQRDAGGRLARTLLPTTLLVPLLLLLIVRQLGERPGLIDLPFGRALLLLALMALFSYLVWSASVRLSSESKARDHAERSSAAMLERERAARSAAERAGQLKDDFVATVSHELRTPLNAMLGWSSIIRSDGADAAQVQRGLDVIERNARLQARLIDDLLDMSRILSGKLTVEPQLTEVCGLVQAAVSAQAPAAEAKSITITSCFLPSQIHLHVDPARLQQVVWNLLSNALKFTPKAGSVVVEARVATGSVEISVQDSGVGISDEFLPHVFDRFRQADSSITRRHGGLGLGLSIARKLVELHGGTLRVASAGPGHGSVFTIVLPARAVNDVASDSADTASSETTAGGQSARLSGVTVLIVEDDDDARELLEQVLSGAGASVTAARNVADAIDLLSHCGARVVVTDIGMPGQDGYALVRHVRANPNTATLPAIALTAFARPEDRSQALAEGFDAHLTKPIDFAALLSTIERLIAKS